MTEKVMFTVPELAARWGFSRDTIYRMVRSGEIKACPFKHIRVLREEVERWEENGDRTMWVRTTSARSTIKKSGSLKLSSGIAGRMDDPNDNDSTHTVRQRVEERLMNGLLSVALSKKL